jgi:hypothetical protein
MTNTENTLMSNRIWVTTAAVWALCGCATTPLEADYGQSVKQLVDNQVFDRNTLSKPTTTPAEGADPDMLNLAVQSLRAEKTDRSQVAQPLTINIGGGK